MATTSEARALPFFTDLIGQPLSSGFIYIGQAGLDPVAYPAVIHSDIAGTTVVAQPVRTTNGHAAAAGALIHLFVPIPYSITILDSAGRLVYASLNETDPVAVAIGSSSVQSSASLADLRARSKASTNQVWVSGFGMYVYQPTDTTSPENIPFVIVGNDGARYALNTQFLNAGWVGVNGASPAGPNVAAGTWIGYNDDGSSATFLHNRVTGATGGFVFRSVNASSGADIARVTIDINGVITCSSINSSGSVTAAGNVTASGGTVTLNAAGTRSIAYNTAGSVYQLAGANLLLNGSLAVNDSRLPSVLSSNQFNFGVGSITLTNAGAPPANPGTWTALVTGLGASGIALFVRVA